MKSSDALRNLGGNASLQDVLSYYRDRYGRGASRALADRYGVTQRTAQRALRGDTRSPKFAATEKFQGDSAAAAVRRIHVAHAGDVSVEYDGNDDGQRYIGDVELSDADREDIAGHLRGDEPDWEAAGDAMDEAILENWCSGLSNALTISDYETGLTFD